MSVTNRATSRIFYINLTLWKLLIFLYLSNAEKGSQTTSYKSYLWLIRLPFYCTAVSVMIVHRVTPRSRKKETHLFLFPYFVNPCTLFQFRLAKRLLPKRAYDDATFTFTLLHGSYNMTIIPLWRHDLTDSDRQHVKFITANRCDSEILLKLTVLAHER